MPIFVSQDVVVIAIGRIPFVAVMKKNVNNKKRK